MSLGIHDSGASHFRDTMWSIVAGAQNDSDPDRRKQCLAFLCKNYWKPIYYYIRRRGLSHEDALDHTQEYFATFLEKNFVAAADRERGRFRTFVLVTVNRFLSKQLAKKSRTDRTVSLFTVTEDGEEELSLPELQYGQTAEDDFNRRWALQLLESTLDKMKHQCAEGRKHFYYETLKMHIESMAGSKPLPYKVMADRLGVSETDVTNFLHRGRNIFQKLLREEIRQSVTSESAVDQEIEALKDYLRPKD